MCVFKNSLSGIVLSMLFIFSLNCFFLNKYFNNTCRLIDGEISLCEAAAKGDIHRVKDLIKSGINVNFADSDGNTPLILASFYGYTEIVKLLIQAADVNKSNDKGITALAIAIKQKHAEIVQILITANNLEINKPINGYAPLIGAIMSGDPKIVKILITAKGIDFNVKNYGYTPLTLAVDNREVDIVRLLVPNYDSWDLNIALKIAKEKNYLEIADFIEQKLTEKSTNSSSVKIFSEKDIEEKISLIQDKFSTVKNIFENNKSLSYICDLFFGSLNELLLIQYSIDDENLKNKISEFISHEEFYELRNLFVQFCNKFNIPILPKEVECVSIANENIQKLGRYAQTLIGIPEKYQLPVYIHKNSKMIGFTTSNLISLNENILKAPYIFQLFTLLHEAVHAKQHHWVEALIDPFSENLKRLHYYQEKLADTLALKTLNCFKCTLELNDIIKDSVTKICDGYLSKQDFLKIAKEQQEQCLLCEKHKNQ